jgi:3',5'-nucleoside bisphosphate phosphatase
MARGRRAPTTDRVVPPEPATADFHAHTSRSDGLLAPLELLAAAAAAGVRTIAITDHDTLVGVRELAGGGVAGGADEAGSAGVPAGMVVIPGVEINTVARGLDLPDGELHVVGLGVDPADAAFEDVLACQRAHRRQRFGRMREQLRAAGYGIDAHLDGLQRPGDDAPGRPLLARALVAAGFAESVQDAFVRFVGPGGPGYAPREGIDAPTAIAAIRAAGGLPILAHFGVAPRLEPLARELMAIGLAGIETHHRSFDARTVAEMTAFAARLGLLASGGTDYHGDECTYAESIAETWIPAALAGGVSAALAGRARPASETTGGTW